MKKLFFMFLVGMFLIGIGGQAFALNYSVALTTFAADNNAGAVVSFAAEYPNVDGGIHIRKIVFTTTNSIAVPVLIRVYDTATSTTAATIDGYWVFTGTNTSSPGNHTYEIDYPKEESAGLFYTDPGFYSDTAQTTVKIYMTLIYE